MIVSPLESALKEIHSVLSTATLTSTHTIIMATTTSGATVYHSYKFPAFTTSTNIGPLTKSLAFNTGCYTNMIDMNRNGLGPSGAWKTLGCAMSSCCPSGNIYTEEWAWMTSYYSPGVCPSDYQSCAPPTQSGLSLTPKTGEKIVFCCPNSRCSNCAQLGPC